MQKIYFYTLIMCLLCTMQMYAATKQEEQQFITAADETVLDNFEDILAQQESVVDFHDHIEEEVELVALEEHASNPTPPSQMTVTMRKFGLKILLAYIAVQSYFEQVWDGFKTTITRLSNWFLGDAANET